uniref:Uncharacterized protein n=1 Tax=Timema bartmani TaxID=61472 RepID=A0A7R9EP61_9NEOP|nr:unnamed protein product [Timema bartmani]
MADSEGGSEQDDVSFLRTYLLKLYSCTHESEFGPIPEPLINRIILEVRWIKPGTSGTVSREFDHFTLDNTSALAQSMALLPTDKKVPGSIASGTDSITPTSVAPWYNALLSQ